ncbi:hypothetical protein PSTG_15616 [Puccinia striiformis f. sp. tritici PST-78]|uniref:Uncharacterized protein n=1 Tax=Puccinia striiformis f. sp. tritici PST-78 TaxID=1165861 RepID=A0A0L0UVE4_9BASI|nr:hypothetical protein PSTG_15616 [Puccinia striiformis f. sp. tritici PST-78]
MGQRLRFSATWVSFDGVIQWVQPFTEQMDCTPLYASSEKHGFCPDMKLSKIIITLSLLQGYHGMRLSSHPQKVGNEVVSDIASREAAPAYPTSNRVERTATNVNNGEHAQGIVSTQGNAAGGGGVEGIQQAIDSDIQQAMELDRRRRREARYHINLGPLMRGMLTFIFLEWSWIMGRQIMHGCWNHSG